MPEWLFLGRELAIGSTSNGREEEITLADVTSMREDLELTVSTIKTLIIWKSSEGNDARMTPESILKSSFRR